MTFVRTVRGDIDPSELGVTHLHEHLITFPPPVAGDDDYTMDSQDAAIEELRLFAEAGGRSLVEMTPIDYGRSPEALHSVAEKSGIHIIMVTGWLKEKFSAPHVENRTVHDLAEQMSRDILEGVNGVKAGVIKASSSLNTITPNEEKIFRAAAIAHRETGALISTHSEGGTMCLEQVQLLKSEGMPPERILIGHVDRNLDWNLHLALANTGVAMGFDQISKAKYYSDERRLDFIVQLVELGFEKQIALSCDFARKSNWISYGGAPGLRYLLAEFVPMLEARGLNMNTFLVDTPARLLAMGN